MKKLILFFLLIPSVYKANQLEVSFDKNFSTTEKSIEITINDVTQLLKQYQNRLTEKVKLTIHFVKNPTEDSLMKKGSYPIHNFRLDYTYSTSQKIADLTIQSESFQGLVFGIYAFLQERLGIKFYHPKKTEINYPEQWLLKDNFSFAASPKFQLRGFHLQTLYPIDLTEFLMDPQWAAEGKGEVKAYIDWLIRNGQNYMQFYLLESVNLKKWIPYFKELEEYAHNRGLLLGLRLSLHSIVEKPYALYDNWPKSWISKEKQVVKRIAKLNQLKWDYWTVDFYNHAYNEEKAPKIQEYKEIVLNELAKFKVKLVEADRKEESSSLMNDSLTEALNKNAIKLVETGLFYSLKEENIIAKNTEDFSKQLDELTVSRDGKEVWFSPTSSYWRTYDNSIPTTLTPYLQARLDDIRLLQDKRIDAHITSSSGWEWGYSLVDWSIARWTWDYKRENESTEFITSFFTTKDQKKLIEEIVELQEVFIKDSNLIQFLTTQSPLDGLSKNITDKDLTPSPSTSYKQIRNDGNKAELDDYEHKAFLLKKFARQTENIVIELRELITTEIQKEILDGFEITSLRAQHKAHIMEYLVEKRSFYFDRNRSDHVLDSILYQAKCTREDAQVIVNQRRLVYKYPNIVVGAKYNGLTAYSFGYLYPVSDLFFWKREELQAKNNKYGARYKNYYPLLKISGKID